MANSSLEQSVDQGAERASIDGTRPLLLSLVRGGVVDDGSHRFVKNDILLRRAKRGVDEPFRPVGRMPPFGREAIDPSLGRKVKVVWERYPNPCLTDADTPDAEGGASTCVEFECQAHWLSVLSVQVLSPQVQLHWPRRAQCALCQLICHTS